MQPDKRDAAYLWDILDAARTVEELSSVWILPNIQTTEGHSLQ